MPVTSISQISRGIMLFPLLLLVLLPGLMADTVCFRVHNGTIHMNTTNNSISDEKNGEKSCDLGGLFCINQCTLKNKTRFLRSFNGSHGCFEAETTFQKGMAEYKLRDMTCAVYICEPKPIRTLMDQLNNDKSLTKEMDKLYYIIDLCSERFQSDNGIKKSFTETEKHIIHNIMADTRLSAGESKVLDLYAIAVNVVNVSESKLNLSGTEPRIEFQVPQLNLPNETSTPSVWLPANALRDIPQDQRLVSLVSYKDHRQFKLKKELQIVSMVIRIELLGDRRLQELATSVKMTFRDLELKNMDNDTRLNCCFFDEKYSLWKTDGCETHNETSGNQTDIICYCNHTTPFAVLLIREEISQLHWEILSYISYIGCGLSAFFTALSIVIYVFSGNQRSDYSISIHVSLSGALFLLNTTFLLSEWGATVEHDWVCVLVAALMHYSLLCCFTWMAIEALHLYLLLIKVFNTYYKHYLVKLSLAGWGVPGVIVAVSLGVKDFKQFYGATQMTVSDTNQTNSICWITDESFFYSLNLVYFTLIFVFNTGILVAVASSICKMKQVLSRPKLGGEAEGKKNSRVPQRFSESCKGGLTVLGLTCLMGTTWGLAFLGSGYVNYPILYLFCILNSTQGFFIFLWICLSAKKQRKREMEERMSSTPVRTMDTKSE